MFFAPWCHHCKQAMPEWIKLANINIKDTKIGIVNCDANPEVCGALSVHGYPSMILFTKNGTAYDYRSSRRLESFAEFLKGGYVSHPMRVLKKTSISSSMYEFVNSLDVFSFTVGCTLVATFWFIVFRFFFSETTQEIAPAQKTD